MSKTVWIIGAGASKSHSGGRFPTADRLLAHLLDRYFSSPLTELNKGTLAPDSEVGMLAFRKYLLKRLGQDLSDRSTVQDLEAILGFIESDIEVYQDPSLLLARDFLVHLVRVGLVAIHGDETDNRGEYHQLADSLTPADSLITFNWDILLDNALGRELLVTSEGPPSYGKSARQYEAFFRRFSGVSAGSIENLSPPGPVSVGSAFEGIFLKLHGSIDWLACANPLCENRQLVFPLRAVEARCGVCLEQLHAVLVPPVVVKRVREWAVLRRLWTRAAAEVGAADELVIWGYSLPAIDFQSRWLLSHAQTGGLERIAIINPVISGRGTLEDAPHAAFVDSLRRALGSALRRASISLFDSYQSMREAMPPEHPQWHEALVAKLRAV